MSVEEYIKLKNKFYKDRRNNEMTSTFVSLLLDGVYFNHAVNITNECFPVENCFIDRGNVIEVLD